MYSDIMILFCTFNFLYLDFRLTMMIIMIDLGGARNQTHTDEMKITVVDMNIRLHQRSLSKILDLTLQKRRYLIT